MTGTIAAALTCFPLRGTTGSPIKFLILFLSCKAHIYMHLIDPQHIIILPLSQLWLQVLREQGWCLLLLALIKPDNLTKNALLFMEKA